MSDITYIRKDIADKKLNVALDALDECQRALMIAERDFYQLAYSVEGLYCADARGKIQQAIKEIGEM